MKKQIYKGSISGGQCGKVFMDYDDASSSVEFPGGSEPYVIITIGCYYDDWCDIYEGILHEVVEYHMMNMELAYQRAYRAGNDTGDVWFHMDHAQYSEVIARTAQTIQCFIENARSEYESHIETIKAAMTAKEAKSKKSKKAE